MIILKKDREKSVERRHPWVFSGAIGEIKGVPASGDAVQVRSSAGKVLGYGHYSAASQIAVRLWSFDKSICLDVALLRERMARAHAYRQALIDHNTTNCYRLINSEADGLPGLIVDRYNDFLVCQFLSAGVEKWQSEIVEELGKLGTVKGIYNRSDADVRAKEGLESAAGVLFGETPPDLVEVMENGSRFYIDVKQGHKTGFYLDQRDNRQILGEYASNREILNCFSYTGGFGVYGLKSGAGKVTNIDASAPALELLRKNMALNGFAESRYDAVCGDVFGLLRQYRDRGNQFDLIVLDPPKFVESKNALMSGARGYKDINLLALKLLKPQGLLFTFSCSGHVDAQLFQKIVADAAVDAQRDIKILRRLEQSRCHATLLSFPEGDYLKGLVVGVY